MTHMVDTTDAGALAALIDGEAVRAQITRFSRCLDERRWADAAALFTDDGALELPVGSWSGPAAILARVEADLAGYAATQHVSANHDVELHADTARVRTTFIATHVTDGDGTAFWRGGGIYHLELRRVDGSWRISRLRIEPVWRSATDTAFPAHEPT